ncbi:polysaccharide pyruvyl transferase family protein [Sulfuriroseicoccus oceanibius]|uniref:Polysaccharide pyruvyl transferase family protein n=1 Tax=Sulfuriroseicoccus oceanibius TaxID=2707525 RepID=A0A6B3L596_9BACT|nr:polysaccharide pyruvyl transferase family protein [Sulfuriroseicoccus oceanibius]QQL44315.1 polysaccharide pyruvyl transferase family protein [Sulfuriroseicoccus oceanibius]
MNIQVEGIGFPNKGAELMLYAVVQELRSHYGDKVNVCCAPRQSIRYSYKVLGCKDISQLGHFTFKGVDLDWMVDLVPQKLVDTFGVTKSRDVDIILDASGLRYSDKWGSVGAKKVARRYEAARKRGKKIVMLPQAFGPFRDPEVAKATCRILDCVDVCFARDSISADYLKSVLTDASKLRVAPDFTNLLAPYVGDDCSAKYEGVVLVIPNTRMLDKTSESVSSVYYDYLCNFIEVCVGRGETVVLLNHEGAKDEEICANLSRRYGGLDVFSSWDPIMIKTVIGRAKYIMSSRFHGCVSALSQGVPVIATSWNHKYETLLDEYGLAENLETLGSSEVDLAMIDRCEDKAVKRRIEVISEEMKAKSREMWNDVFSLL